jgi:hypothetical protein
MRNKYDIRNQQAKIKGEGSRKSKFSSTIFYDEKIESLVYSRMLNPNIVLILHKNKLLTIKIVKCSPFF